MASSCRKTHTGIYLKDKITRRSKKIIMSLFKRNTNYQKIPEPERMAIIERSCKQVSRGVFFSTVIIIASFLPVFLLTGQEGKLFHPLAYTKSFILIVDALLVI